MYPVCGRVRRGGGKMGSLARLARRAVETNMPVMVQVGLILLEVLDLLVDIGLSGSFFGYIGIWDWNLNRLVRVM